MNAAKLSVVMIGVLLLGGPVSANVGDQVVDGVIPFGAVPTLDGDLSVDWADAVWRKADQPFTPTSPNLTLDPDWDPEWTARWNGDTIYLAVRVVDNTSFLTDSYVEFPASDRIEIYSRGSGLAGGPGTYGLSAPGYEPAQQYFVGITNASLASGGADSWGTLGATEFDPPAFPENRVLVNDGTDAIEVATSATDNGGGTYTLIYEVAIKQYNSFDATSAATSGTGLRTLAVGDTVGFAVAPGSRFNTFVPGPGSDAGFAATVSAGGGPNMFANFDLFGLYQLVTDLGDFDEDTDIDGFDFLQWQRGESPLPLGTSDLSDWEGNFGATGVGPLAGLAASAAAVPEPSTAVLLSLALAGLATSRRRRR